MLVVRSNILEVLVNIQESRAYFVYFPFLTIKGYVVLTQCAKYD